MSSKNARQRRVEQERRHAADRDADEGEQHGIGQVQPLGGGLHDADDDQKPGNDQGHAGNAVQIHRPGKMGDVVMIGAWVVIVKVPEGRGRAARAHRPAHRSRSRHRSPFAACMTEAQLRQNRRGGVAAPAVSGLSSPPRRLCPQPGAVRSTRKPSECPTTCRPRSATRPKPEALYGKLEERILARDQKGASDVYYDLRARSAGR